MDLCKKKKAEVTNKSAKAAAALGALLAPSVQQEPLQKKIISRFSVFTEKGIISLLFIFPAVGGGPAVRARDGNAHAREMAPT